MTFFSHHLHFYPLIDQKLRKQQLVPYFFSKNHLLFSKNYSKYVLPVKFEKPRKTLAVLKTPEKTLGLREKTPEP